MTRSENEISEAACSKLALGFSRKLSLPWKFQKGKVGGLSPSLSVSPPLPLHFSSSPLVGLVRSCHLPKARDDYLIFTSSCDRACASNRETAVGSIGLFFNIKLEGKEEQKEGDGMQGS